MKKAIEFLRSQNIQVSDKGTILSRLPEDEAGISLIDELELATIDTFIECCYTIIDNHVTAIEI